MSDFSSVSVKPYVLEPLNPEAPLWLVPSCNDAPQKGVSLPSLKEDGRTLFVRQTSAHLKKDEPLPCAPWLWLESSEAYEHPCDTDDILHSQSLPSWALHQDLMQRLHDGIIQRLFVPIVDAPLLLKRLPDPLLGRIVWVVRIDKKGRQNPDAWLHYFAGKKLGGLHLYNPEAKASIQGFDPMALMQFLQRYYHDDIPLSYSGGVRRSADLIQLVRMKRNDLQCVIADAMDASSYARLEPKDTIKDMRMRVHKFYPPTQ